MGRNFFNLEVFNKSYAFVLECYPAVDTLLPKEDPSMAQQLRRALVSIPVNIAEGCGSHSEKVLLNHLSYAYGSAREVEVLVMLCRDLCYWDESVVDILLKQLDDVKKMLFGLMKKVESSIDSGKVKFRYNGPPHR